MKQNEQQYSQIQSISQGFTAKHNSASKIQNKMLQKYNVPLAFSLLNLNKK